MGCRDLFVCTSVVGPRGARRLGRLAWGQTGHGCALHRLNQSRDRCLVVGPDCLE